MSTKSKEIEEIDVLDKETNSLVIHNDNVNSFEHVINCLIKYCGHSEHQAENCAVIIDGKGKCDVKSGDFEELYPVKAALQENGLTCSIE